MLFDLFFLGIGPLKAYSFEAKSKHALLIGISNYIPGSDWQAINSSNDIKLLHQVLLKKGFSEGSVSIMENSEATKAGIIDALKSKCTTVLKPGDLFYFHFSGHGQQKQDLNHDEVDGLDECIVPYDSPKNFIDGKYSGDKLISDDELSVLFDCIRKKLGPSGHLLITIDACHSGTGIRGYNSCVRGSDIKMISNVNTIVSSEVLEENTITNMESWNSKNLASTIAFFGSSQHQLNYEYKDQDGINFGSLSYSFAKSILNANSTSSYRLLYDKIRVEMARIAPNQNPQFEGNLDRLILNGDLTEKVDQFIITQKLNDSMFYINGGFINGLTVGSILGFNQPSDSDLNYTGKQFQARVVQTKAMSALVMFNTAISEDRSKKLKLFILERNALPEISGFFISSKERSLSSEIYDFLLTKPFLKFDSIHPKIHIKIFPNVQNGIKVRVESDKAICLDSLNFLPNQLNYRSLAKLTDVIKNYLRGEYFKTLDFQSKELNLVLTLNSKSMNLQGKARINGEKGNIVSKQQKILKLGSSVSFSVTNNGTLPAYFCLLDIQPDNKIKLLFPRGSHTPEDYRILPSQQLNLKDVFTIAKPTGFETFKLIATTNPFDFNLQFNNRSVINDSAIKCVFSENLFDLLDSRSVINLGVEEGAITVFTDVYNIVE